MNKKYTILGMLGKVGNLNARQSTWTGAFLAGILGGLVGGASGFVFRAVLDWLGVLVSQGDLVVFTALVGSFAASLLFLVLWFIK